MLARNDHAGRRVLCVFPRYTPSFGTFEFSYPLTDNVRAFMPPQGLLVIAAAVPPAWPVRFIDENMAPATDDDFAWAEVVFVSGMHVQRRQIEDIRRRAQSFDKVAVLGGSSVSACPGALSGLRLPACRRARRRHRRIVRAAVRQRRRGRHRQVVLTTKLAARARPSSRSRPTSSPRSTAICSAASSSPAAARTSASSATSRRCTAASPATRRRSSSAPSSTSWSPAGCRPRSISSTTTSSPTRRRCARCCRI